MDRSIYTRMDLDNEIGQHSDITTLLPGDTPNRMVEIYIKGVGTYVVGKELPVHKLLSLVGGDAGPDADLWKSTSYGGYHRLERFRKIGYYDYNERHLIVK